MLPKSQKERVVFKMICCRSLPLDENQRDVVTASSELLTHFYTFFCSY